MSNEQEPRFLERAKQWMAQPEHKLGLAAIACLMTVLPNPVAEPLGREVSTTTNSDCKKPANLTSMQYPKAMNLDVAYVRPASGVLIDGFDKGELDELRAPELFEALDKKLPFPLKSTELSDKPMYEQKEQITTWVEALAKDFSGLPLSFVEHGFIQGIAFKNQVKNEKGEPTPYVIGNNGILSINMGSTDTGTFVGIEAMWHGVLREAGLLDCEDASELRSLDLQFMNFKDGSAMMYRVGRDGEKLEDALKQTLNIIAMGGSYDSAWRYYDDHTTLTLFGGDTQHQDKDWAANAQQILEIVNSIDTHLGDQLFGTLLDVQDENTSARRLEREKEWRRLASENSLANYIGIDQDQAKELAPLFPAAIVNDIGSELDLPYLDIPVEDRSVGLRFDAKNQRIIAIVDGGSVGRWGNVSENLQWNATDEMYVLSAFSQILGVDPTALKTGSFNITSDDNFVEHGIAVDARGWEGFKRIVE